MIKGIDVTYFHTPNKELSDWYCEKLGLEKGYSDDHWHGINVKEGSGFGFDIIGFPSSTVQKQSIMISFKVDDIHAAVKEFAAKGVRFYPDNDIEKTIFDVGPKLVATCEDPDGNFFQLSQIK
jgi:extradiol dioxygenase family protein